MKVGSFFILAVLSILISCSENNRKSIPKSGSFGVAINLNDTFFSPNDTSNLDETMFTGEIVNYCKGEGCWLSLKNDKGKPILVEVKDKGFVLPLDINGSSAFVKGELKYSPGDKFDFKIVAEGITIK